VFEYSSNIDPGIILKTIEEKQFTVLYQPIIDITTNTIRSVEALTRFHTGFSYLDNPQTFIPLAESFYGNYFTRRLYDHILLDSLEIKVPIHLNLSANGVSFLNQIDPLDNIYIEITEEYFCDVTKLNFLKKKIEKGFVIGIDDFGSGYNSLGYFFNDGVNFSFVKFDQTLIQSASVNPQKMMGFCKLVEVFQKYLGVTVICEGVEKEDQLAILCDIDGCFQYVQGFLYHKPMTKSDLLATLNRLDD
jgi:EAL domain-containing protein (putative c-di-GMP-specific phosphodiesterase class I)